jgi:fatty aldehyde-generating acyl-ACP reductase
MNKFAFIIHPMDLKRDAARKYPILKYLPLVAVEEIAKRISPKVMSHITGIESPTGARAEGWFIGCPLSPEQQLKLPTEFVYEKIADAGRVGAELGAKIVGLGAFTSVVGDAGVTIAQKLDGVISVTSGNSYTVYTAIEGLLKAAELMETDVPNAKVSIIGATGSIGAVCAQLLAPKVAAISLAGRNVEKLEELKQKVEATPGCRAAISYTTEVKESLRDANLVLAVSSAVDAVVFPEDLKRGAVVCDVARPRDVSKSVVEKRNDVLVIEGGVIEIPGHVNFNFNFGFPDKTAYACMSETILMALEGTYEPFTLGRDLTVEQVQRIGTIADKHGFKLAGFRSFEKALDDATLQSVRANAKRKN